VTDEIGGAGADRLLTVLSGYVSPIIARSLLRVGLRRAGLPERGHVALTAALVAAVASGLKLYIADEGRRTECERKLVRALGVRGVESSVIALAAEGDVVDARSHARNLALDVGFCHTDQVRIATAVSEIARNALSYAGGGTVRMERVSTPRSGIRVAVEDRGPGIQDLDTILGGRYRSKTGLGLGLLGCRRLMDAFHVETGRGAGTTVTMEKYVS